MIASVFEAPSPPPTGTTPSIPLRNAWGRRPNLLDSLHRPGSVSSPLNTRRHPKADPVADVVADARFWDGVRLFNDGQHWHAHESWEPVWMGLEGDDKLFLQGLIMAAAMLHQYGRRVPTGVSNHYANVQRRIPSGSRMKWGLDVGGLVAELAAFDAAARGGEWGLPARVQLRRV